ncbi:MAG TPA: hypothetical protein VGR29_11390 [Thermomicrobiales bacterium]|nr:hypothetical protein [Thermomicrobiales bacterium]
MHRVFSMWILAGAFRPVCYVVCIVAGLYLLEMIVEIIWPTSGKDDDVDDLLARVQRMENCAGAHPS